MYSYSAILAQGVGGWLLDFTRLMLISTQVEAVIEVGVELGNKENWNSSQKELENMCVLFLWRISLLSNCFSGTMVKHWRDSLIVLLLVTFCPNLASYKTCCLSSKSKKFQMLSSKKKISSIFCSRVSPFYTFHWWY